MECGCKGFLVRHRENREGESHVHLCFRYEAISQKLKLFWSQEKKKLFVIEPISQENVFEDEQPSYSLIYILDCCQFNFLLEELVCEQYFLLNIVVLVVYWYKQATNLVGHIRWSTNPVAVLVFLTVIYTVLHGTVLTLVIHSFKSNFLRLFVQETGLDSLFFTIF